MTPKLTICIPSLFPRRWHSLHALISCLYNQSRADEVEILVHADFRRATPGSKRNKLVSIASGDFIVHIDDDDLVSNRYIPAILEAIELNRNADVVLVRGMRTGWGEPQIFDYRIGVDPHVENGVHLRTPCHLCPVRADIAKAVPFDATAWAGEDLPWGEAIRPYLIASARAGEPGEVLYHYQIDPNK